MADISFYRQWSLITSPATAPSGKARHYSSLPPRGNSMLTGMTAIGSRWTQSGNANSWSSIGPRATHHGQRLAVEPRFLGPPPRLAHGSYRFQRRVGGGDARRTRGIGNRRRIGAGRDTQPLAFVQW